MWFHSKPFPDRTASTNLWVFASQVSIHGCAGGHLCPTEVTRLGLHLLVGQVDVLLQHVLCQILLIARGARPRLTHCREKQGSGVSPGGTDGNSCLHEQPIIHSSTLPVL